MFLPSKHLLSAFYNPPPSKNPSKNPCPYSNPYKAPSKNPSKKALPLKNLLRTLLRSVRLHDPLGVHPTLIGHPQTCVYPDVCLGIAHFSGKSLLSGQGKRGDTQCICPFRPTDSLVRKGQIHCVSARFLVLREGPLPDTWAIPKHTPG